MRIRLWLQLHSPAYYIKRWWYKKHPITEEQEQVLADEFKDSLWGLQREMEEEQLDTPETINAIVNMEKVLDKALAEKHAKVTKVKD